MAQILGAGVRIFKTVAFSICWCPQLLCCCAEQFTVLEISTASFDTDAKIYSNRRTVRLKMKTHKIKSIKKTKTWNKTKSPRKEKKIRDFFFFHRKKLRFNRLIFLASIQASLLFSSFCSCCVVLHPFHDLPIPISLPQICLSRAEDGDCVMSRLMSWAGDVCVSEGRGRS